MFQTVRQCLLWGLLFIFMGCSSTPDNDHASQVNDPLEPVNRVTWSLNYDYLDPYFFRPVSLAYVNHVPTPARSAISNFFSNLDEPASMLNNLLMGNVRQAVNHFNRFWMNSTFGLLGLIDIASAAGIEKEDKRGFGDVLGHYGVGNGPYLMVPVAGPYTARSATNYVDVTYLPLSLLNVWASVGKFVFQGMETRASLVSQEPMLNHSPDPYAVARDAYLQRQDYLAEKPDDASAPDPESDLMKQYLNE